MEELIKEEAKQEEKVEQVDVETKNEEKQPKLFTEEEVAEIKKNAIAEGMRKASKKQETQSNEELETLKTSLSEKESLIAEKQQQMDELNQELTAIKQVKKMDDLGIDRKYQEDVIALIKGKGLEVSEETISEIAENHPEWKIDAEIGVEFMGQTKPQANPYDEAKAREEKEIREKFRL